MMLAWNVAAQPEPRHAVEGTIGHPTPFILSPEFRADDKQWQEEERLRREREEFCCAILNTAPMLIWASGLDKLCTYFNQPWLQFTGRSLEAELGNGWAEGVHPEDLKRCLDTYTRAFDLRQPFEMEYRLRRHDGKYRWIFDQGVPSFNKDGSFGGYIGSAFDITERKLTEEANSKLSQKLIQAQEEERASVKRELHDQIDSLILLSVNLDCFDHNSPELKPEVREEIAKTREHAQQIVSDVIALSHRLRSSKLEYLGLAATMASLCKELSDAPKMKIDFRSEGVPNELPEEIAVSLYRVLQEYLQNATEHSGSPFVEVLLRGESDQIELAVRDWGSGSDPTVATKDRGLGLAVMKERLKLVHGELSIESQPKHSTMIRARVPLKL
jgi:PAS domain S-box-containing protein